MFSNCFFSVVFVRKCEIFGRLTIFICIILPKTIIVIITFITTHQTHKIGTRPHSLTSIHKISRDVTTHTQHSIHTERLHITNARNAAWQGRDNGQEPEQGRSKVAKMELMYISPHLQNAWLVLEHSSLLIKTLLTI